MLRREEVFDDLMEIGLELPWRDFERLVDEAFRRQGFTVTGFGRNPSGLGRNGPYGGVDLGLTKNGERFFAALAGPSTSPRTNRRATVLSKKLVAQKRGSHFLWNLASLVAGEFV